VVSDRGSQFAVEFMKKLNRMLGIETELSTLFHPQTDGLSYTSPLVQKYISVVESPPNHTSPPSMAATLLTTHLMAVL